MSVKISELPILDSLADNDVLAGVDTSANVTKKIELATLKEYIDTNTTYTAGTNIDITNNVVSAPNVYNKDEMDSQIEELQSEVDSLNTIYNAFPTVSDEDTSMTLDGTAETKFKKFDLKGNTSQSGTPTPSTPINVNVVSGDNEVVVCGKNLINTNKNPDFVYGNTEYTRNEDIIDVKNNNTSSSTRIYSAIQYYINGLKPNTQYTISFNAQILGNSIISVDVLNKRDDLGGTSTRLVRIDGTTATTLQTLSGTFTTPADTSQLSFVMYSLRGTYYENADTQYSNIMVAKGTDTTYEPYTGATYPINLPVENLFDKDNANILSAYLQTNSIVAYGNNRVIYIPVTQGETYTIQKLIGNGNLVYGFTQNTPVIGNQTIIGYTSWVSKEATVTVPTNGNYLAITIYRDADNSYTPEEVLGGLQIEKGTKANSYTPYGTTPIELCSSQDGTKRDYFLHDKTLDKWYKVGTIGKKIFNGTENWNSTTFANLYWASINGYVANNGILNQFSFNTGNASDNNGANYLLNNNQSVLRTGTTEDRLYVKSSDFNSDTALETWLTTNNLILYYVLATPTNTEITYQPLIEQLNAIEKAMSYNGQTNISQVNNDLPFIINAEAILSLQNVLDRVTLLES